MLSCMLEDVRIWTRRNFMTPIFKLSLWGPYALFSRPELKVERCSYDVITPSAAQMCIRDRNY